MPEDPEKEVKIKLQTALKKIIARLPEHTLIHPKAYFKTFWSQQLPPWTAKEPTVLCQSLHVLDFLVMVFIKAKYHCVKLKTY